MKKNHRINTLPERIKEWLINQEESFIEKKLKSIICQKMKELGIDVNDLDALEDQIQENDQQYLDLQETNDINESMVFFCRARLISAAKFLQLGELDDAIYEYFYSFNTDNEEEIIKEIINI